MGDVIEAQAVEVPDAGRSPARHDEGDGRQQRDEEDGAVHVENGSAHESVDVGQHRQNPDHPGPESICDSRIGGTELRVPVKVETLPQILVHETAADGILQEVMHRHRQGQSHDNHGSVQPEDQRGRAENASGA